MEYKGWVVIECGDPMLQELQDIILLFETEQLARTFAVHPRDVRPATLIVEKPKKGKR